MKQTLRSLPLLNRLARLIRNILRLNRLVYRMQMNDKHVHTVITQNQQRLDALEGVAQSFQQQISENAQIFQQRLDDNARAALQRLELLEEIARTSQKRLDALEGVTQSLQKRPDALEGIAAHFRQRLEILETSVTPATTKAIADQIYSELDSFQRRINQEKAFNTSSGKRPRLAFVSPLPPERSGISGYSAELLPALARHYQIDVIVNQPVISNAWINTFCPVHGPDWFREHASDYERIVYQFGNSPFHSHMFDLLKAHPGVVVLHDFFLSGVLAYEESTGAMPGIWTRALYHSHGYHAVQESFADAGIDHARSTYPSNLDVLQAARGVIVHAAYSRQLACDWYGAHAADAWEVIPLVRAAALQPDRLTARDVLDIPAEAFVVCSFGFIDPVKQTHRLLDAWLGSTLAADPQCLLMLVGANHPGAYGDALAERIRAAGHGNRIRITGWVDDATYRQYLQAADAGVQLRAFTRGETSAAVLDCMNHGLPTIINSHGSLGELPEDATWKLPDAFSDSDLITALESLRRHPDQRAAIGHAARQRIHSRHSPEHCAQRYVEAIESAYGSAMAKPRVLRQLLIDVSAIQQNDLKTGIERVVRAQLMELLRHPPAGLRVEPVYLAEEQGDWHYRYARRYTKTLLGMEAALLDDAPVRIEATDVFYSPDYYPGGVLAAAQTGLYADWRKRGVAINFLIHDLLPIMHPEFFPPGAERLHAQWLACIGQEADRLVCISHAVAEETRSWLAGQERQDARRPEIAVVHHGADISSSAPSSGMPDDAAATLAHIGATPSFLMVGTIEPRKGHLQTLAAFKQLWGMRNEGNEGNDVKLVIVGAEGWTPLAEHDRRTIPEIVRQLRSHPELGKRLIWLQGISDEYLQKVYAASACLLAPSEGEGFGLPLIEAAQHGLPIIARDLPVFREVAREHAFYFRGAAPEDLGEAIRRWLNLHAEGKAPASAGMGWRTWVQNVTELVAVVSGEQDRQTAPPALFASTTGTLKE